MVGVQGITMPDEVLARGTERGLDVQREGAQAPSTGRGKQWQLQDVLVQVHGDVCPQLIRKVMQKLEEVGRRRVIIF